MLLANVSASCPRKFPAVPARKVKSETAPRLAKYEVAFMWGRMAQSERLPMGKLRPPSKVGGGRAWWRKNRSDFRGDRPSGFPTLAPARTNHLTFNIEFLDRRDFVPSLKTLRDALSDVR